MAKFIVSGRIFREDSDKLAIISNVILNSESAEDPIITLSVAGGNQPIVDGVNSPITGTYNYTLLEGAAVATATFVQAAADLVLDINGEGTITISGGAQSTNDPMILVIQNSTTNSIIGAFEAFIS